MVRLRREAEARGGAILRDGTAWRGTSAEGTMNRAPTTSRRHKML